MKHALQAALASNIRSSKPSRRAPGFGAAVSIPHLPPLKFPNVDLLGEILARADDCAQDAPAGMNRHERAYSAPPALFKALLSDSLNASRRVGPYPRCGPYNLSQMPLITYLHAC